MIRLTAEGIQWVKTQGKVIYGKINLKISCGGMDDLGHGRLFRAMMCFHNLPEDPQLIDVGNDIPGPDPTVAEEYHVEPNDWEEFERNPTSFTELLMSGVELERTPNHSDERPSPVRPRRLVGSPDRLTYSRGHIRKRHVWISDPLSLCQFYLILLKFLI